jgi:DNA polymerase-3 subunit epsilon
MSDPFDWEDSGPNYKADRDAAIRWAREILETDFVVLDTETTGLGYDDEAVSIGLVSKAREVLLDTLLCHEKPCDPKALATHGVSWEATREAPHFRDVFPRLVELSGKKILVGYNVSFDARIIEQMIRRYDLGLPIFRADHTADVMQKFAEFYGQWNDYHESYTWKKLTYAAAYFGIATSRAHGAAADALMTLRVIEAMAGAKLSGEEIE